MLSTFQIEKYFESNKRIQKFDFIFYEEQSELDFIPMCSHVSKIVRWNSCNWSLLGEQIRRFDLKIKLFEVIKECVQII